MKEKGCKQYCDNCKISIFCYTEDIGKCKCSTVELSFEARRFLSKTNFNCLCNNCLEVINKNVAAAESHCLPTQKDEFIEGVHFYKEGSRWVFTQLYHMLKGSCCGNGCRHCVYGLKSNLNKRYGNERIPIKPGTE